MRGCLSFDVASCVVAIVGIACLHGRGFGAASSSTPQQLSSQEIEAQFTLPPGFEIRLLAAEPDIANPMTMCVDEHGTLFVTEAHTYRWGTNGSPFHPPTNPIKRIQLDSEGRVTNVMVAAEGFPDPVMGVHARNDKLYATCLNELFVMDVADDGRLANRKLLVKDDATPWNPFGMYRVAIGPDNKLWLAIADHPGSLPVTLTGSDGRKIRLRGQSGGMVRCNLDGSGLELIVQGFRAPYAFDIDPWGHIWHISNGEGSPNLYVHVIPGVDYGYATRKSSYAWLAGELASSPPVRDMGAGANTAALHYYSSMFPSHYWGSIFVSNWGSHGSNPSNRVITVLRRGREGERIGQGDTELSAGEIFLSSVDPKFRPTQVVLAPDGGLYVLDWHGRDDENDRTGRLFNISRAGAKREWDEQPESASRDTLTGLLGYANQTVRERAIRQLAAGGTDSLNLLSNAVEHSDPFTAANAIWALTQITSQQASRAMVRALKHKDARVRAHAVRQLRQCAAQTPGGAASANPPLMSLSELAELTKPLLEDPDAEVRIESALAQQTPSAVVQGLLEGLRIARDYRLLYQVAFGLAKSAEADTIKRLLASNDSNHRRVATITIEIARQEQTPLAAAANELERLAPSGLARSTPEKAPIALVAFANNNAPDISRVFNLVRTGRVEHVTWMRLLTNSCDRTAIAALRAAREISDEPSREEVTAVLRDRGQHLAQRGPVIAEEARLTLLALGITNGVANNSARDVATTVLAALPQASPALGRESFMSPRLGCATCHSPQPGEVRFGPSLARLGSSTSPEYLIESVLEPSRVIKTGFLCEEVETIDGELHVGLTEASGDQLRIQTAPGQRTVIPMAEVKRRAPVTISPMPEGLETAMSQAELADVVAYLLSLK